jgi:GNAT superfamily N-acetyltransferase
MRAYIDIVEKANSELTRATLDAFAEQTKAELGLKAFYLFLTDGGIKLDSLIVQKGDQGKGLGTKAVEAVCALADQHGIRVLLTPGTTDKHNGTTSRARLVRFYRQFGFVENKGRYRDFSISAGMIREPKGRLHEAADLRFRVEAHGFHHGQQDLRLVAARGTEIVGYVDYSVYQGEVAVKMIQTVGPERQGTGTAMMQQLQREHPGEEIDWGGMTEPGAGLYRKLAWDEVEVPEVRAKMERIAALRTRLDGFQAAVDAFHAGNPTDEARERLMALVEPWNDVHDEVERLEDELRHSRVGPTKRLIRTA